MTHKTWKSGKGSRRFPPGEYIKFYCYANIKHENRKFSLVTLSSRLPFGERKFERAGGKIKLLIAANNQLLISLKLWGAWLKWMNIKCGTVYIFSVVGISGIFTISRSSERRRESQGRKAGWEGCELRKKLHPHGFGGWRLVWVFEDASYRVFKAVHMEFFK